MRQNKQLTCNVYKDTGIKNSGALAKQNKSSQMFEFKSPFQKLMHYG